MSKHMQKWESMESDKFSAQMSLSRICVGANAAGPWFSDSLQPSSLVRDLAEIRKKKMKEQIGKAYRLGL